MTGCAPCPRRWRRCGPIARGGGTVILVTNSPKPRAGVRTQLAQFGVPEDAWDSIATSGDSARAAMFRGAVGSKVWFMGEEARDAGFFDPIKVIDDPVPIDPRGAGRGRGHRLLRSLRSAGRSGAEPAAVPLCQAEGAEAALRQSRHRGGSRASVREWCAGALARLYTEMGGDSLYFGKPHPPIYDLARRRLAEFGQVPADSAILAIGDGLHTDILGAMGEDIDSLFVTGGLAAAETKTTHQPDPEALSAYVAAQMITPSFAIGQLR